MKSQDQILLFYPVNVALVALIVRLVAEPSKQMIPSENRGSILGKTRYLKKEHKIVLINTCAIKLFNNCGLNKLSITYSLCWFNYILDRRKVTIPNT